MIEPSSSWSRQFIGEFQIVLGVALFGVSFVGQKYAMSGNHPIQPITYNAWRFLVSSALLIVFRPFLQSVSSSDFELHEGNEEDSALRLECDKQQSDNHDNGDFRLKQLWYWGLICGLANFIGSVLQQISLVTVPVASVGFITGMFVVVVPIVEQFILGRGDKINSRSWVAACCSLLGLYFISGCALSNDCFSDSEAMGKLLVFVSMFCWVASILAGDIAVKLVDCISLTCVDFVICTVLNFLLAVVFEPDEWQFPFPSLQRHWMPIVLVGFSEAAAFTAVTLGQMYTPGCYFFPLITDVSGGFA